MFCINRKIVYFMSLSCVFLFCLGCSREQVDNRKNIVNDVQMKNAHSVNVGEKEDSIYKFDSTKNAIVDLNANNDYNIDDFYMDYVDENIYSANDGIIDKVSVVSFEIEEYIKNHCVKETNINDLKNKLLNDKNIKKARTFNDFLVVARQDASYKNDKIEIYDNKLNLVSEIKGYCYFVIYEKENVLIIKHRYNNIDLYEENSSDIEYFWYKDEVMYGYNIVDKDLKMFFEVPVASINCRYIKNNNKQIDDIVLCKDFYKSYIYDMNKREAVKKLNGVDYKTTYLNDVFAMEVDNIDLKDKKIKIIVSNGKFHTIDDKFNKLNIFSDNMISFTNKNYEFSNEVILMEDKSNKYFKHDESLRDDKNKYAYWSVDGKKIIDEKENVKILEYGYYVIDNEKYDVKSKEDGELIKLELSNVDKNKNKILNIKFSKDENFSSKKLRINRFFGKDFYYVQQNQFFSDYYNIYDANSNLILKDIRYREIYKEDKSKNFKNGLLVLESGKEKDDNNMSGILLYCDKDFNEIKEKTNYTTSLSNTRIVKIDEKSFLLFTSKGMEHLMDLTTLKEFKYDKYTNFNSIYFTGNTFEIVWNREKKFVVDANLSIVTTEEIKK